MDLLKSLETYTNVGNVTKIAIIDFVVNYAIPNNGGSINIPSTKVNPTTGFMVSLQGFEDRFKLTSNNHYEELAKKIIEFYKKHENVFYSNSIYYLGTWLDTTDNIWYLDISANTQGKNMSLEMAKLNNQIAIWDCENKETIYTGLKH